MRNIVVLVCLGVVVTGITAVARAGVPALKIPNAVVMEKDSDFHATFTLHPLNTRQAQPVADLLKSLIANEFDGYAFTTMKIPGATAGTQIAPGCSESIDVIAASLKAVRLEKIIDGDDKVFVSVRGKDVFAAGDIAKHTNAYAIVNPKKVICHLTGKKQRFDIELTVGTGRGTRSAAENVDPNASPGEIPLASVFNPIVSVTATATADVSSGETSTVVVDVTTDGTITAEAAYRDAAKALSAMSGALEQP